MRYHLHEQIDFSGTELFGAATHIASVPWVVHEVEPPAHRNNSLGKATSWHAKVGHGTSMTGTRSLFDLLLLLRDVRELDELHIPYDAHTDYYMGVTHEAYVEHKLAEMKSRNPDMIIDVYSIGGETSEKLRAHLALASLYMHRRIHRVYNNHTVVYGGDNSYLGIQNGEISYLESADGRWAVLHTLGQMHAGILVSTGTVTTHATNPNLDRPM